MRALLGYNAAYRCISKEAFAMNKAARISRLTYMQTMTPYLLRVIKKIYGFLCSFYVLLSVFFVLLMLLICESCGFIALPHPYHNPIFGFSFVVLYNLSLFIIPISTLWVRICSPLSPWVRKHALLFAIAMMSTSILAYPEPIFEGFTMYLNRTFIYCLLLPVVLGSISFLFVHGLYGLVCFIYRCIYKTLSKKCQYIYAGCVSYIYLVFFLIGFGGNVFR